jgi:hypothetical protein
VHARMLCKPLPIVFVAREHGKSLLGRCVFGNMVRMKLRGRMADGWRPNVPDVNCTAWGNAPVGLTGLVPSRSIGTGVGRPSAACVGSGRCSARPHPAPHRCPPCDGTGTCSGVPWSTRSTSVRWPWCPCAYVGDDAPRCTWGRGQEGGSVAAPRAGTTVPERTSRRGSQTSRCGGGT